MDYSDISDEELSSCVYENMENVENMDGVLIQSSVTDLGSGSQDIVPTPPSATVTATAATATTAVAITTTTTTTTRGGC